MHDINKVIMLGNVSRAPEMKEDGTVSFELVTSRNVNGVEDKHFQTVVASGSKGVFCINYISKGSRVYVEGYIRKVRRTLSPDVENYEHRNKEVSVWFLEATDIAPGSKLERVNNLDPFTAPMQSTPGQTFSQDNFSDLK